MQEPVTPPIALVGMDFADLERRVLGPGVMYAAIQRLNQIPIMATVDEVNQIREHQAQAKAPKPNRHQRRKAAAKARRKK